MYNIRTNNNDAVAYNEYPDFCPICHRSAQVELLSTNAYLFPEAKSFSEQKMQLLFRCPRKACGSQFIVEYQNQYFGKEGDIFMANKIFPAIPKTFDITDGILDISPSFVSIVTQAQKADADGLDEIAGIGFRKALEFLIKDYCIYLHKDKEELIKKMLLGQCIAEFVTDANLKACAKRAAWLGNDEAHYVRKWTTHDIKDLQTLIRLTMHWISNELLTAKYMNELQEGK